MRILVVNDGTMTASRGAGLGTRWFDAVSPDSWVLEERSDGAGIVLDVRLRDAVAGEVVR